MTACKSTHPGTRETMDEVLTDLYEHQALLLMSVVSHHNLSDGLMWDLARILDASLRRTRRLLDKRQFDQEISVRDGSEAPHPAIAEFLRGLCSDQGNLSEEVPT